MDKVKTFDGHFNMLLDKLKNDENFAFARFSDGEMYLLMDRSTTLGDGWYEIDGVRNGGSYHPINYKNIDSSKHGFFYDALKESFKYHAENYFVGLSCRCCVGDANFKWQVDLRGGDDDHLTWSNLLINGNFNRFSNEMVPLFSDKKVVFIGNETLDLGKLPFKVEKDFRVGNNCMINNFDISDEIIKWIKENDIKNHLFLFSASSLSEVLIHKLFMTEKENTYIDIGTGLNLHFGVDTNRGYLRGGPGKICIW
tara:strand:+ start:10551 stop:11312 length:762 start_codon:yes stop_codon:yes gene_type:complete